MLFTPPVAQQLMLGEKDVFTSVDVKAAAGVSDDQLRDDVAAALGDDYTVQDRRAADRRARPSLKRGPERSSTTS